MKPIVVHGMNPGYNKLPDSASVARTGEWSSPLPNNINSQNKKTLGDILPSYPFTEEEQKRIALLATSDSLPRYILTKYAPRTKLYKEGFEKKEKIPGFRPGMEAYNKKAIPRLIEHLSDPNFRNYEFCWNIYKSAAIQFVQTELPALNNLLAGVVYENEDKNASDLLKSICTNAFDYEVKSEDVKKFYEVWWIDRVETFEQIVVLCSKRDETRIQAKQINKLLNDQNELKKSLQDLSNQVASQSSLITQTNKTVATDHDRISKNESFIQSIDSKIADTTSVITTTINSRLTAIDDKLQKLKEKITTCEQQLTDNAKITTLKAELTNLAKENKAAVENAQESYFTTLTQSLTEQIANKLEEFEQKLATLSNEVTNKPNKNFGTSTYKSPLATTWSRGPLTFKITKEEDFLNSWANWLSQKQKISISFEQIIACHSAFLANNVIVSDLKFVTSWIDCLGWNSFAKHIIASPTWSNEEDWGEGAEHIFSKDNTNKYTPKLLIIHNYDIGLVDCYLIPSLLLWSLCNEQKNIFSKIFLIPSGQELTPNYQVLNHATYVTPYHFQEQNNLQLRDSVPRDTLIRKEIPIGVNQQIVMQWLQVHSPIDYDFTPIQKSFPNLELNDWLISNFQRTVSLSNKFLQESSAIGVGMYYHILPWVRSKYGASEHNALNAYLKQLPGVIY